MKVFRGWRGPDGSARLWVEQYPNGYHLQPGWKIWKFGTGRMDWTGTYDERCQAALALLLDAAKNEAAAFHLYDHMVQRVFPKLSPDGFEVDELSLSWWAVHTLTERTDEAVCGSPYRLLNWGDNAN